MKKPTGVIPLQDYLRIFSMTRAVLDGVDADTLKACVFFSVAGAAILRECYGKNAGAVAGAAFYNVCAEKPNVLGFAHVDNAGQVSSSENAFHAWTMCDDIAIDFAAPMFPEYYGEFGAMGKVERRMFQKPIGRMGADIQDLDRLGDFYLQPDMLRTMEVREAFDSSMQNHDLVNICLEWYQRPPRTMKSRFTLKDNYGEIVDLKMQQVQVSGVW